MATPERMHRPGVEVFGQRRRCTTVLSMADGGTGKSTATDAVPVKESTEQVARRRRASRAAAITAVVILAAVLVATFAFRGQEVPVESRTTTTVTEITTGGTDAGKKVTESTEVTLPGRDDSLLGRALGTGATPLLIQLLVAGLAAFVAGAIVQRIWLGEYGFTVGPVSLPALAPVSDESATQAVDLIKESPDLSDITGPGPRRPAPFPQFFSIADRRLALISIRIELEERLRELAAAVGLDEDIDIYRLPGRLVRKQVFDTKAAQGLEQLLQLGDRVVAGAEVEEKADQKVRDTALSVLYALSELKRRANAGEELRRGR
jgi:hypothetical protein